MKLFGDYAIRSSANHGTTQHMLVGVRDGEDRGPVLYLHKSLGTQIDVDRDVTLTPSSISSGDVFKAANILIPLENPDGLVLWIYAAEHPRQRIQRSECVGALIVGHGYFGRSVAAVCRADRAATLVFRHNAYTERVRREPDGQVIAITEFDPAFVRTAEVSA
jgi:hypothetical protein